MTAPPRWTEEELAEEIETARRLFRDERLSESLEGWKATFDRYKSQYKQLFDEYGIADPASLTPEQLSDIFKNNLGDALRYLTGPPISEDDLNTLANASLAPSRILEDTEGAQRILETIVQAIDPRRFPWIAGRRPPTRTEKSFAILASAAMIAAQRVLTNRRNDGKTAQETGVKQYLSRIGFREVPSRVIRTLTDAPGSGEFCAESKVGTRKADIPVRLFDGRLMPIECKVSNSALNSVKRVNNDAQAKAGQWLREFGTSQVVPVAVLSGVFKVHNLIQAQNGGLTLFWAHQLEYMGEFIEATRSR